VALPPAAVDAAVDAAVELAGDIVLLGGMVMVLEIEK
jgi:hypothetical protein